MFTLTNGFSLSFFYMLTSKTSSGHFELSLTSLKYTICVKIPRAHRKETVDTSYLRHPFKYHFCWLAQQREYLWDLEITLCLRMLASSNKPFSCNTHLLWPGYSSSKQQGSVYLVAELDNVDLLFAPLHILSLTILTQNKLSVINSS